MPDAKETFTQHKPMCLNVSLQRGSGLMQLVLQRTVWLSPLFAAFHKKYLAAKTDASLYLTYLLKERLNCLLLFKHFNPM